MILCVTTQKQALLSSMENISRQACIAVVSKLRAVAPYGAMEINQGSHRILTKPTSTYIMFSNGSHIVRGFGGYCLIFNAKECVCDGGWTAVLPHFPNSSLSNP